MSLPTSDHVTFRTRAVYLLTPQTVFLILQTRAIFWHYFHCHLSKFEIWPLCRPLIGPTQFMSHPWLLHQDFPCSLKLWYTGQKNHISDKEPFILFRLDNDPGVNAVVFLRCCNRMFMLFMYYVEYNIWYVSNKLCISSFLILKQCKNEVYSDIIVS